MRFESPRQRYDTFVAKLGDLAGIVEERVVGEEIRSPSVQLRITPLVDVLDREAEAAMRQDPLPTP
jgi:hypothetical protein